MAHLNSIDKLPFMGDFVRDIRFHIGTSMVTIYFQSGKDITLHISDDGSYTRKDYHSDKMKNIRELKIDSIIE